MLLRTLLLSAALAAPLSAGEVKETAKDVGHAFRDLGKAVKKGAKQAGKKTKQAAKDVGHGARDAAKDLKRAAKEAAK